MGLMLSFLHKFISPKADGPDSTLLGPSAWNDEHALTTDQSGIVLGRDTSDSGDIQELPLAIDPDGTMHVGGNGAIDLPSGTSAQRPAPASNGMIRYNVDNNLLEAYVNGSWTTVVTGSAMPVGGTIGWYSNTLPAGGWLFCNGETFGSGASAATHANDLYENLYLFCWTNLDNTVCPVTGGRGATAAADWAAGNPMGLPDERGAVTAGSDTMGGTATAGHLDIVANPAGVDGTKLGYVGGESLHTLVIAEMPGHNHPGTKSGGFAGSGGGSGIPVPDGSVTTGNTGGDGPHNTVQRTMIKNTIIKF
jgi:hypothetical protein